MKLLLLFLLNFKGALGGGVGYYNPSLQEFNYWLKGTERSELQSTYTIGGQASTDFMKIFKLSLEGDWFKGKSNDGNQKLELVPVDGYIGVGRYLVPALLYFYIHGGYEICYVNYKSKDADTTSEINGYANGAVIKASAEFLPTQRLGVEFAVGYRFVKSAELKGLPSANNPAKPGELLPMNLWGPFFKVALLREFK